MVDLSKLSMAELRDLQEQTKREYKQREKNDLENARNAIYAIAHKLGLPLKDVVGSGSARPAAKVAAQYRNPANAAEVWTGRGRQPLWVKKLLAAGASLDSARI